MEQTLVGMERVLFEVREEGDDFELNPKLQNYFENEVKLTEDQIQLIQDTVI